MSKVGKYGRWSDILQQRGEDVVVGALYSSRVAGLASHIATDDLGHRQSLGIYRFDPAVMMMVVMHVKIVIVPVCERLPGLPLQNTLTALLSQWSLKSLSFLWTLKTLKMRIYVNEGRLNNQASQHLTLRMCNKDVQMKAASY